MRVDTKIDHEDFHDSQNAAFRVSTPLVIGCNAVRSEKNVELITPTNGLMKYS